MPEARLNRCPKCDLYLHPGEIHDKDDCIENLQASLEVANKTIELMKMEIKSMERELDSLYKAD